MKRARRLLFSVVVLLSVAGVAVLLGTGRLQVRWSRPGGAGERPEAGGAHEAHFGEEHEGEEGSRIKEGKLVLTAEEFKESGITTRPVAKGSVAITLRATGEVQIAENRMAHVTPRNPGTIRDIHKNLGDTVEAGAVLCTIQSVELGEAKAAYVASLAERTLTERNFGRWKELFEKGLKTQNELWTAENELTRAKLHQDAAANKLRAMGATQAEVEDLRTRGDEAITNYYPLMSPIAGEVLDRHATLGESFEAKDQVYLIADISEVWILTAIYEKDLGLVRNGMVGRVKSLAFQGEFQGQVTYVAQRVDEKTRTVALRLAVKNGPAEGKGERFALRPGMFVTVDLETSRKDGVPTLPLSALQEVGGQTVAFVRTPPPDGSAAAFERRRVVLGIRDAQVAEVVDGVQVGEEVVTENGYLVKSEFERSQIGSHEH